MWGEFSHGDESADLPTESDMAERGGVITRAETTFEALQRWHCVQM